MLIRQPKHRQVIHDPAIRRADAGIAGLAGAHLGCVVDDQVVHQGLGLGAFDINLSHCGQVLHADMRAGVQVFSLHITIAVHIQKPAADRTHLRAHGAGKGVKGGTA